MQSNLLLPNQNLSARPQPYQKKTFKKALKVEFFALMQMAWLIQWVPSKEDVQEGIESGIFCTDANGLANSMGAVIKQNGKLYRCVKAYGENFTEHQKLVWVELTMKNDQAVTAD
jgi:hypothetical protein